MDSPFKLCSNFLPTGDQPQAIDRLVEGFLAGKNFQTLLGVTGSGKTFTMANIIQKLGKKTLILAPNKTLAAQLFAEFKNFFPENAVSYFVSYYDYYRPEAYVVNTDTYIEKDSAINDEIDKLRHATTRNLLEREDSIVVASVSCIYGIGPPDDYAKLKITLFVDEKLDRDQLLRNLVDIQFSRNDYEFSRGTFRVRGDSVEIFPTYEEDNAIRVEFFDDQIEGLFLIDPLRGVVIKNLFKAVIYPSSHYVVGEERTRYAMGTIREELLERLQELEGMGKLVERQRLENRTLLDLEMMEEMGFCSGIENYSRHLTQTNPGEPPPTLIDFFRKDFLLMVDESHITIPQVRGMYAGDRSRKMNLVEHGFRLPSALDNRPLNFEEFELRIKRALFVSATPADYELQKSEGEIVQQIIRPTGLIDPFVEVKSAKTQVEDLVNEVKKEIAKGFRILVTTLTKKLAEELSSYFKTLGLKVCYLHSDVNTLERVEILRDLRLGVYDILIGINLLREGLDLPEVSLVAILDADREGFLRSARSLIQTIGRAARNSEGRVILYAHKVTGSMQEAIDETSRRRIIQESHNQKHKITPKTVAKKIDGGVIEILQAAKKTLKHNKKLKMKKEGQWNPQELELRIAQLGGEMKKAAKQLNFEEAARIRDEIKQLKEIFLIL